MITERLQNGDKNVIGRLACLRPPHQKEYGAQAGAVRQRPTPTQARSRLVKGEDGPSDSALAAARGGRLCRPAADRHAARCASRALCSGVRPLALYALGGKNGSRPRSILWKRWLGERASAG